MAVVSVQSTPRYEPAALDRAIAAHFDALEVASDLRPGMRVLLKPNLLAGRDPACAVTTHPEVLAAVARWLRAHGIDQITLADSPGGLYTPAALRKVYTACGLDALRPLMTLNEDVSHGQKNGFNPLRLFGVELVGNAEFLSIVVHNQSRIGFYLVGDNHAAD